MKNYLLKICLILLFILLGASSLLSFSKIAQAEETVQIANCGEGDSAMKAYDGKDMTCEFSDKVRNRAGKILPLHLKWDLPSANHPNNFCVITCSRYDGLSCGGAYSKDSNGMASYGSYLSDPSLSKLETTDDIYLDPVAFKVSSGNIYQFGCLWRDSPSVPMESTFTNYLNLMTPCFMEPLESEGDGTNSFRWPGAKGNQDDKLRAPQAFLSDFYKLYQQMVKDKPEPDKCNPLKFDNGTCYISTQDQYRPGSKGPHGTGEAVDIVCDTKTDGTKIPLTSSDDERCSIVDKLIARVRKANGETEFNGLSECSNKEFASGGNALHLHLDQLLRVPPGKKPCLFSSTSSSPGIRGPVDWSFCGPF